MTDFPPLPPGKSGWPWVGPALGSTVPGEGGLPRISVVMPTFNQGPFIEASLRSVLLQGYENLEFIVIDGGSTDGTVEIIRKYEPWLSHWVSEPDAGQSDALRKGFARATGEVLAWLNSDDLYCPGALRSVGDHYRRHPEAGLVYGDSAVIDAAGVVRDPIRGEAGGFERLLARNIIPQPSAFFSRRAFEEVGGINPELHFIMDYELWLRMLRQGVVSHYLPERLSLFRWYRISKSGSYSPRFGFEYLAFLERAVREWDDERLGKAKLPAFHNAFTMVMACNGQGADDGDIVRALERWKRHLQQYREEYRRAPALWADSLYRMGEACCLRGDMAQGRACFAESLAIRRTVRNLAFPGWLASFLGPRAYRRYTGACRSLAASVRRWR